MGKFHIKWVKDLLNTRACLKNVNTPKRRSVFHHNAPIFLEMHPVFPRKIVFFWRKNPPPLRVSLFFKRRLIFRYDYLYEKTSPIPLYFFKIFRAGYSPAAPQRPLRQNISRPETSRRLTHICHCVFFNSAISPLCRFTTA